MEQAVLMDKDSLRLVLTFLGILAAMNKMLTAGTAKLLQLFRNLIIALFVVSRNVVRGIAPGTKPGSKLTFSSSHKSNKI